MPTVQELRSIFSGSDTGFNTVAARVETRMGGLLDLAMKNNQAFDALSDTWAAMVGPLGGVIDGIKDLTASMRSLNRVASSTAPEDYEDGLHGMGVAAMATEGRITTLTAQVAALNAELGRTRSMKNALQVTPPPVISPSNAGPNRSTGGISTAGVRNLASLGSALVRGGEIGVGTAIGSEFFSAQFETAMARVQEWAGATKAEMASLRPEVLDVAKAFGIMPEKIADASYVLMSMGDHGKKLLDDMRASAEAAASGLGDIHDVVLAGTSVMQAYGEKAGLTLKGVYDIVGKGVQLSKRAPEEMFKSLGQTLPIAAALKVRFQDLMAAEAIMTREGFSSAQGFTALRQIMNSLAAPTSAMQKAFAALHLDPAKIRADLQKNLLGGLDELKNAAHGKLQEIMSLAGARRGGAALLSITNPATEAENKAAFDQMNDSIGGVDKAWKIASDTIGVKFQQALVTAKVAAIDLGEALKDDFGGILEGLKKAVDWFEHLPPAIKRSVGELLLLGGGAAILSGSILKLMPAFSGLIKVVAAIGPEGVLALAAITLGVVGAVAAWKTNFGHFRDHATNMMEDVNKHWEKMWPHMSYVFNEAWDAYGGKIEALFDNLMRGMELYLDFQLKWIDNWVYAWSHSVALIKTAIIDGFSDGFKSVKSIVFGVSESILGSVVTMVGGVLTQLDKLVQAAKDIASAVPGFGGIAALIPSLKPIADGTLKVGGNLGTGAKSNFSIWDKAFGSELTGIKPGGGKISPLGDSATGDGGVVTPQQKVTGAIQAALAKGALPSASAGGYNAGGFDTGDGEDLSGKKPKKPKPIAIDSDAIFFNIAKGFKNPGPNGESACADAASYILQQLTDGMLKHPISNAAQLRDYFLNTLGAAPVGAGQAKPGALGFKAGTGASGVHVGILLPDGSVFEMNGSHDMDGNPNVGRNHKRNIWGRDKNPVQDGWTFADIPDKFLKDGFKAGGLQPGAQLIIDKAQTLTDRIGDLAQAFRLAKNGGKATSFGDEAINGQYADADAKRAALQKSAAEIPVLALVQAAQTLKSLYGYQSQFMKGDDGKLKGDDITTGVAFEIATAAIKKQGDEKKQQAEDQDKAAKELLKTDKERVKAWAEYNKTWKEIFNKGREAYTASQAEFTKAFAEGKLKLSQIMTGRTSSNDRADLIEKIRAQYGPKGDGGGWSEKQINDLADQQMSIPKAEEQMGFNANFNQALAAVNRSMAEFGRLTKAARIAAIEFGADGKRAMEDWQAATVDAVNQHMEKIRAQRDQMKEFVGDLSDSIGAGMRKVNQGFGAGLQAMVQTLDQSLRDMVLKIMQSKIQQYLMGVFGQNSAPPAATGTASRQGGDFLSTLMGSFGGGGGAADSGGSAGGFWAEMLSGLGGAGGTGGAASAGEGAIAFATGGFAHPGSMALVGERGPEMMYLPPSGGAHVYTNQQSRSMAMGGDTHNHTYNISVPIAHGMNDDDARRSARVFGRALATEIGRAHKANR